MAASKEWWEYHLTPNGWVDGDYRLDFGKTQTFPTPEDRVLTICQTETMGSGFSPIETTWREVFRSDDEELINELLEKYGKHGFK